MLSPAQTIFDEFRGELGLACDNCGLLRNPVNLALVQADEDHTFSDVSDRENTIKFIAAGRLHRQKGFDRLIEKLGKTAMAYDWSLTILGEGPERANLEALVTAHKLQDRISMPGLSKRPWPHYARADCFLLPSRGEGLPNVALESLACGTPVIATRESGGIAEIAALAGQNAVRVVNNMDEFLIAMQCLPPSPTPPLRPSLLPADFTPEEVSAQFARYIEESLHHPHHR